MTRSRGFVATFSLATFPRIGHFIQSRKGRFNPNARTIGRLLSPLRVGGAALLYGLGARAWLFHEMRHVEATPFSYDPHCCSAFQLAHWAREDVRFALYCTLLSLVMAGSSLLVSWHRTGGGAAKHPLLAHVPAALALFCLGLIHTVYYRVALIMHAQLDYALISEALQSGFDWADFLEYASPIDALLVLAPVSLYVALGRATARGRTLQGLALVGSGTILLAIPNPGAHAPRTPLWVNPAATVLTSIAEGNKPRPFANLELLPTALELDALGLRELTPPNTVPTTTGTPPTQVSVVVVIMESVGRRYAFGGEPEPIMPNLTRLRDSSLYLSNHLSPSNSSANSLFSFFTGLYPSPSRAVFATQPDVRLPVLHTFLPWIRDAFLVTPGRLNSYFPRALLTNAHMELHDRYNLGLKQARPYAGYSGADERDGVDSFLARLSQADAPFFGVYYSYAAHYAYYDHGPEFRVMPNLDSSIDRYNNNLRLLDTQLKRILDAIQARPERTLLVVLGDHGEAFGQHPGNFKHSRKSYQENFETFALLHLPGMFPERAVRERTMHVDLAPTILSGLGVPFAASQFQGVDLADPTPTRPYVFLYGNEDTLSSIDSSDIKVQLSYSSGTCRAFDLLRDPTERTGLRCDEFRDQMERTGQFHAFQPRALRALQNSLPH